MNHHQHHGTVHGLRRGLLIHAVAFLAVNTVLVAIDVFTSPDDLWFYWPLAGWGAGLVCHAVGVYFAIRAHQHSPAKGKGHLTPT